MFTRILVPLDGSKLSEQVLPHAAILARGLGGGLHLMHALEAAAEGHQPLLGDAVLAGERARAHRYLVSLQDRVQQSHLPVTISVVPGRAPDVIVAEAQRESADAIAMATHGRSGMERLFLGSVTDRVLHNTHLPLLLVRPRDEIPSGKEVTLRRILVPLDGSRLAEEVLPPVERIARSLGLAVHLLRVVTVTPLAFSDGYGLDTSAQVYMDVLESLEDEADRYLDEKAAGLQAAGIATCVSRGKVDPAGTIIARSAAEEGTLVIMSTHGRSGVGRMVMGSVADRVVRGYQGPVMLLRAQA